MKRKVFALVLLILYVFSNVAVSLANTPYVSYFYDFRKNAVPCPPPYLPDYTITGVDLGVGPFSHPQDFHIGPDENFYIVDTNNNRIVVTDKEWNVIRIITTFKTQTGEEDSLYNPYGVFVNEQGNIYIADYGNQRAVVLDPDLNLIMQITQKDVEKDIGNEFKVSKIVADKSGRIYLIAEGIMDGVMEFYSDGYFSGFIGANRVTPNIAEYFWKKLASQQQREGMIKFVPEQFSNINIDHNGFIYTTTGALNIQGVAESANTDTRQTLAPVRKLNPAGDNILRRANDDFPQVGDYQYPPPSATGFTRVGPSSFVDVCIEPDTGIYNVLDNKRGRVFSYDEDGNLLYVFSGYGNQVGLSRAPVAIDYLNDQIYVLDRTEARITVFTLTAYGRKIKEALKAHASGDYLKAAEIWEVVKKYNANYDLAYVGIGKSLHRQKRYREAMENFKLGNNRKFYSRSFKLYRKAIVQEYFGVMVSVFFGLLILTLVLKKFRQARVRKGMVV